MNLPHSTYMFMSLHESCASIIIYIYNKVSIKQSYNILVLQFWDGSLKNKCCN